VVFSSFSRKILVHVLEISHDRFFPLAFQLIMYTAIISLNVKQCSDFKTRHYITNNRDGTFLQNYAERQDKTYTHSELLSDDIFLFMFFSTVYCCL
jgi:hypothetical protein